MDKIILDTDIGDDIEQAIRFLPCVAAEPTGRVVQDEFGALDAERHAAEVEDHEVPELRRSVNRVTDDVVGIPDDVHRAIIPPTIHGGQRDNHVGSREPDRSQENTKRQTDRRSTHGRAPAQSASQISPLRARLG